MGELIIAMLSICCAQTMKGSMSTPTGLFRGDWAFTLSSTHSSLEQGPQGLA